MRSSSIKLLLTITTALALTAALPAVAQIAMPPANATHFTDTSMLKPPADAKVAIVEFEDLECPACASASPLVHAALAKYHIPFLRHDFIIQNHIWSRDAAIIARYLQDKVSADLADQYRRDVFAAQRTIDSKDDLQSFSHKWFQSHGQQVPFVIDPAGRFAAEVQADCTLGERLGLQHTPTIIVVTAHQWIEVTETSQLYAAIDRAQSEAGAATTTARSNVRKSATPAK
jgi:protein-disulfide isomerase